MRVYLVRHGEAKPKDEDPERPLSDKGRADARKVAELLGPANLAVESVAHSGKARARQTAEVLGERLSVREGIHEREGLGPNDPVEPVQAMIERAGGDVMLVGHLPQMNRLLGAMLVGREDAEPADFEAGALVCLQRNERSVWKLLWMVAPSLL